MQGSKDNSSSSSRPCTSQSGSSSSLTSSLFNPMLDLQFNRRDPDKRIFCNRNVYLDKIKFFGFDMDYTLAEYNSPALEELIFDLSVTELVKIGYPDVLNTYKYDGDYAARGLIYDTKTGNLLKMDPYGNILMALYGRRFLNIDELKSQYPSRFTDPSDSKRLMFFNSLFELPEVSIISYVIQYFEDHPDWIRHEKGFVQAHTVLTYSTIYKDIRKSIDAVHRQDNLKHTIIRDIKVYIKKHIELPILLHRLRQHGKKLFIATNSEFWYTNAVMAYLLDFQKFPSDEKIVNKDWKEYFDYIVVDAKKPLFFTEGTSLCQIDLETGRPKIGAVTGNTSEKIFSGGSSQELASLMGAYGKDILYVGDHIFGDIVRSKKKQGWRTYLVVPELQNEISAWMSNYAIYEKIRDLESKIADVFITMDSKCTERPNLSAQHSEIHDCVVQWDVSYGNLGSLLRSGSQMTFFANQMLRYADLYSHTCLNLVHYPFCYFFRAVPHLLAHEVTVIPKIVQEQHKAPGQEISEKLRKNTATSLQEDDAISENDFSD